MQLFNAGLSLLVFLGTTGFAEGADARYKRQKLLFCGTASENDDQELIFLLAMQSLLGGTKNLVGRATYTRWGRTSCPDSARLIYKGYAGGTGHNESGGGIGYVCLPDTPTWGRYTDSSTGWVSHMWGAEYQIVAPQRSIFGKANAGGVSTLHDNDVPCAVCQSKYRTNVLMVPGKKECFDGWFPEYTGMLMSERVHPHHKGRSHFVCVDNNPEVRTGGGEDKNGALFHFVKAKCGSLPCPPYVQDRELACAVCTN